MIDSATEYGAAMHDAFRAAPSIHGLRRVYPPRDSGEALIHVNWGNDYQLTKAYHLFVNGPSRRTGHARWWNPALRAARRPGKGGRHSFRRKKRFWSSTS